MAPGNIPIIRIDVDLDLAGTRTLKVRDNINNIKYRDYKSPLCDSPSIDVMRINAQKSMLQAVSANHVARSTQVVFKAFPTLPEYPGYLTIVTTMAASVDVLHT